MPSAPAPVGMPRCRLLALAAVLSGCLTVQVAPEAPAGRAVAVGPSLSAGAVVDELMVDAADADGAVGRAVLAEGAAYLVTVEGTYSGWAAVHWRHVCAGTPEPAPRYRSASATGPVGLDAAYAFATPSSSTVCDRPTPAPRAGWLYRLRPEDPWTLAPTALPYAADHIYRFPFVGAGAPLAVVVRDARGLHGDNYGRLRVTVHEVAR